MIYKCYRCGYIGKQKNHLKNHLNRKNICKPVLEDISIEELKNIYNINKLETLLQIAPNCSKIAPKLLQIAPNCSKMLQKDKCKATCEYCLRTYSRNSNLTKHLKTCKKKQAADMLVLTQSDKIMKMEKEIEELKKYKTQNNTTNNITTNNNINNSKNIYINNYGDENLKHLRSKDFANLLGGIYNAVPKLIEKIHFDPEHPENQNIKYTNKKLPYLKVMKDDKWQLVSKKEELLDLIDNKCFMLKEKYYAILEKKNLKKIKIKQKLKIIKKSKIQKRK